MKFEIIVPSNNEVNNINDFYKKIVKVLKDYDFSLKFIDDGSTDKTWEKIKEIRSQDQKVKGIKFLKNYGKENAISAGLIDQYEFYNFKIVIDADLQHPVEKIPEMINRWENGKKVVGTFRVKSQEGLVREFGSSIFYFLMKKFSDVNLFSKTTDFMLIDKEVISDYRKITEKNKTFRTTINLIHNVEELIEIDIKDRKENISKFNFTNLIRFAVNTFTSFSIFPLKIIGYLGIFLSTVSLFAIPTFFFLNFLNIYPVSYQTIIIIMLVLMNGLILMSLGILAIYITKIYENVNSRPDFIIEEELN